MSRRFRFQFSALHTVKVESSILIVRRHPLRYYAIQRPHDQHSGEVRCQHFVASFRFDFVEGELVSNFRPLLLSLGVRKRHILRVVGISDALNF